MGKLTTIPAVDGANNAKNIPTRAVSSVSQGINPTQATNSVAVKINDYIPGGEKTNIWSGIDLGSTGSTSFLQSFLSNQKALGGGLAGVLGLSKGAAANGLLNQNIPGINGGIVNGIADPTTSIDNSLLSTHGNLLQSTQMKEQLLKNNESLIQNNFSMIRGITPESLNLSKNYVMNGTLLNATESNFLEQKGVLSTNLYNTLSPKASMSVSWGTAFTNALTNPEVIGQVASSIATIPSSEKVLNLLEQGVSFLPTEEQLADPSFDAYVYALQQGYGLLSEQDNELLGLYKYYKVNSLARSNNNNEGFALGEEISDSFFGSINYNVTSFLDGTSDYISETWQNFTYDIADQTRNTIDEFNTFATSFENATGIKLSISPEFENGVWDTMEKLGFGNPGIGTDTMGFINNALIVKTYVTINDTAPIDSENVMFYYEKYKYRENLTTIRKIRIRFLGEQLANLDLDDPNLKMTVKRLYGYSLGQNPNGDLPVMYNTQLQEYDSITNWSAKKVTTERGNKATQKGTKKNKNTQITEDNSKEVNWQEIEFILTPPQLLESKKQDMFNGIPESGMTISHILQAAFELSYAEPAKLALTKPKNDQELKDAAIAPTNFTGLLNKFQSDYDIYEGGPILYHDRLNIGGHEEDIYFVLPKNGIANIEYDNAWTVEFRVRYEDTEPNPEMVVFIIPSKKKIVFPLVSAAVRVPGNDTEFTQPVINRYSKGSIAGVHQGVVSNSGVHQIVKETNTDYIIPKADERERYKTIYIKVDHGFMTFTPADMIIIKLNGETYRGNVKEWSSQQVGNKRIILLTIICEIDKEEKSFTDKLSPSNWISSMQEAIASTNAKITNTLNTLSDNTGNVIQSGIDGFNKWETANGDNLVYSWLNKIDPDISVPEYNQDAAYRNTQAEYEQTLFNVVRDDPLSAF